MIYCCMEKTFRVYRENGIYGRRCMICNKTIWYEKENKELENVQENIELEEEKDEEYFNEFGDLYDLPSVEKIRGR